MKASMMKAVLTDVQFWVPVAVLVIGILLLVYVR
ncbi:MAG TPA: translocated intimin receptor Tir [Terriglobia bacterium]|nr:translocated intimin receptor Tir [Terriglobia bacterium]